MIAAADAWPTSLWTRATQLIASGLLFTLAGCEDSLSPAAPGVPTSSVQSAASPGNDLVIASRFDLAVDVEGSLKPGHPIRLTLRGIANYAAKDAEVRLSLPEVAAGEKSGWGIVEIPVGEETRPHVRLRRGFSAGERFQRGVTVTIPEPGYYFVMATAKQHSSDSDTDLPNLVGDVSGKALWLWIDERGGRVTEQFDTALFAPDMRKERGPRTHKYKAPRTRKKGAQIACTVYPPDSPILYACPGDGETFPSPPPPTATHAFSVAYDKAGGGHVSATVPGIRYVWRVTTTTGQVIATAGGYADGNGDIPPIDCHGPTSERNVQVDVFTDNDRVEVLFGPASMPAGRYTGACGGSNMITANMYMAQAFLSMLRTADGHYDAFRQPVPRKIPVSLNESGATHYFYSIPEVRIYASYQTLFGEFGAFAVAHEWGHMWHDKYLIPPGASSGLIRYYSGCPTEHPPANSTSLSCAFAEAFADWYAVVVREGEVPAWKQHLEENYYHKTCQPGVYVGKVRLTCTDDGSIVQGAIHAFLHDLSDGTQGEIHDVVQFTPAQIAHVVSSCTARLPNANSNIPYNGVDHLIYCMEGRAPYMVRVNGVATTFFNTRPSTAWPQSALGAALALSSDQLRKAWLVNLYSKRAGVGNNPTPASMDWVPGEEPLPAPEPEPCYPDEYRQLMCPIR